MSADEGDDLRSLDWLTSFSLAPDLSPTSSIDSSTSVLSVSSFPPAKDPVHSRKRTSCTNRQSQCTIGCWIYKAILHSDQKALALVDIYDYVKNEHPDHDMLSREWKRSVRHSLSTSQCFSRVSAPESTTRSSHQNPAWWTIHPDYMRTYKSSVMAQGPHHRCPPKNGELSKWSRVKRHASSEYELAQMAQDLSAAAVIFSMNKAKKKPLRRPKSKSPERGDKPSFSANTKHLAISKGLKGDHCYLPPQRIVLKLT